MFTFCANGGFVTNETRIHPTQKPVTLYKWLLKNYAHPGDKNVVVIETVGCDEDLGKDLAMHVAALAPAYANRDSVPAQAVGPLDGDQLGEIVPADDLRIEDPAARKAKFDEMVAAAYQRGKALNQANGFIIDDVIDPADTRRWIVEALKAAGERPRGEGKRLKWIDTW